jgi:regulatory protein
MKMMRGKTITKEQAFQKIKHYCAYQERSHKEVKEKLYSFGLYKVDVEELMSRLIEEDYLNEERFACQFAGGKFRMKQWGKVKIEHELKQKQISAYCIKKGLKEIPDDDYQQTLHRIAEKRYQSLKGEDLYVKRGKLTEYLIMKGYERAMVVEMVKKVTN